MKKIRSATPQEKERLLEEAEQKELISIPKKNKHPLTIDSSNDEKEYIHDKIAIDNVKEEVIEVDEKTEETPKEIPELDSVEPSMEYKVYHVKEVDTLLKEYRGNSPNHGKSEIISFVGASGYDVYNATVPFQDEEQWVVAGRVERRDSNIAQVRFFTKNSQGHWQWDTRRPVFVLQDPFITHINEQLLFGGLEVLSNMPQQSYKRTRLFLGNQVKNLRPFFTGPKDMENMRLIQLTNHEIFLLNYTKDAVGNHKLTYGIFHELEDIKKADLQELETLCIFSPKEWGGTNSMHIIDKNRVGVLGHVARLTQDGKPHYYALSFTISLDTMTCTTPKIIAERKDFARGPSKRMELYDYVYPSGLERLDDGSALLYAGISSAFSGTLQINDPFISI